MISTNIIVSNTQSIEVMSLTNSVNVIVSDTQSIKVTSLITSISGSGIASSIGEIDITNVGDGYVFVYNSDTETYRFEDPDQMLSKSVEDGVLPQNFINILDDKLDNRIDADGGMF
jgi:hypothetical protein